MTMLPKQFSLFFGVGIISTLVDYGTFLSLNQLLGVGAVTAALAGYCLGGLVNYLLNRRHTFQTERTHTEAGWRFAAVMAVGFTLTGLIMKALTGGLLTLPPIIARILTSGIVFIWNFLAHRHWSFAAAK